MARQRIPGLSYIPIDYLHEEDSFQCVGFDLKVFTVPDAQKFGNCRRVTEFHKICTIAKGKFGTIYKVRDAGSNDDYALKKLQIPQSQDNPQVLPQNFLRQINNLKEIKHPNIVNLKEVVVGKNLKSNYLLLDLCKFSLQHVIDQVGALFLQHHHIKNIMHQLLSGLQFIHMFNVMHRDLCPKNILFTETGTLKISDFGSSRTFSPVDMTPNHGLGCYRAPEILFGSTKYTKAVDVWAVGCIFAELIHEKPLFKGIADLDIIKSMLQLLGSPTEHTWPGYSTLPVPRHYHLKKLGYSDLPVPRHYHLKKHEYNRIPDVFNHQNAAFVNYLMKFLKYNPASRPSVDDVMEDPYYQEYPHRCSNEVLVESLRESQKLY